MERIRVLQVIGGGEIGGAEQHLLTLMRLLDRKRFDPCLLCLCQGPFAPLARQHGIPTREILMRHKLDLGTVGPIRRLIREERIDIVHTHGTRANLVARPAAWREGKPVVTTFHSVLRYDYRTGAEALLARLLTRLTNGCTNRFIAVSGAIREEALQDGVPPGKIQVIPNGLDLARFARTRPAGEVRVALGLDPARQVVAVIGRLHPVKGHRYFLEAAARVAGIRPGVQFLVVGDGPLRDELRELVHLLGLDDKVVMTGYYPRIEDIYPVIDVMCLPSLMEGMGLVVLEALYFGVPVVATRVGGIPEIIADGREGILIPPRDAEALATAVLRILNNPELAREMGNRAREKVKQFTVEKMARQVEELYLEILDGR